MLQHQHVLRPTRFMAGQNPSLTDPNYITNVVLKPPIGKKGHRLRSSINLQSSIAASEGTLAYKLSRLHNNSPKNVNSTEKVAE